MLLHPVHLPLHQQTVVYIWNWQVPKLAISPSSSSDGLTRQHKIFAPFFCQSVLFIARQVCELLLSPQSQELLSKATK